MVTDLWWCNLRNWCSRTLHTFWLASSFLSTSSVSLGFCVTDDLSLPPLWLDKEVLEGWLEEPTDFVLAREPAESFCWEKKTPRSNEEVWISSAKWFHTSDTVWNLVLIQKILTPAFSVKNTPLSASDNTFSEKQKAWNSSVVLAPIFHLAFRLVEYQHQNYLVRYSGFIYMM